MASRQGLKPAKRPAAKTVAAENIVRSLREFLVMNYHSPKIKFDKCHFVVYFGKFIDFKD